MSSALVGFGLGFLVAAQIGPMSLFLIRSTLRGGWLLGVSVGAGIAIVDGLYAAAGSAGAAPALEIEPVRLLLGVVGAGVLLWLGVRTLWSAWLIRAGNESDMDVATPGRAFLTSLAGTASNPLTIASWAAVFAAASTAGAARTTAGAALLVAGVAAGSFTSVNVLAGSVALLGRALDGRLMRVAEVCAGLGLLGFGAALGYRTLHDRS